TGAARLPRRRRMRNHAPRDRQGRTGALLRREARHVQSRNAGWGRPVMLAIPDPAPLLAGIGRIGLRQAGSPVPNPTLLPAFDSRVERWHAALAIPHPALLPAFIGRIGWRQAGLALVVPHPALLLAFISGVRRRQTLIAIPNPTLLLTLISRTHWRQAGLAPVVPHRAFPRAFISGVRRRWHAFPSHVAGCPVLAHQPVDAARAIGHLRIAGGTSLARG